MTTAKSWTTGSRHPKPSSQATMPRRRRVRAWRDQHSISARPCHSAPGLSRSMVTRLRLVDDGLAPSQKYRRRWKRLMTTAKSWTTGSRHPKPSSQGAINTRSAPALVILPQDSVVRWLPGCDSSIIFGSCTHSAPGTWPYRWMGGGYYKQPHSQQEWRTLEIASDDPPISSVRHSCCECGCL
jgi:hypothetical protein